MAHAGTMTGGSAQTKQGGSPWPAIALTIAVIVATVAGVWLASSAGLVRGTAKPAAGQSYDQYLNSVLDRAHAAPYVAGAATVPSGASQARTQYLNGILDRAHAAPYVGAATLSSERSLYLNAILDRAHATPYAAGQARNAYLNGILDRAHAAPYAAGAARLPLDRGVEPHASRQGSRPAVGRDHAAESDVGHVPPRQGSRSAHGAGQPERRPRPVAAPPPSRNEGRTPTPGPRSMFRTVEPAPRLAPAIPPPGITRPPAMPGVSSA